MYVINDKVLLNKESFVLVRVREYIEVSTTQFLISNYNTQIIKNVVNREKGKKQHYLELKNIAIIKGFYINIVSKARLREKRV